MTTTKQDTKSRKKRAKSMTPDEMEELIRVWGPNTLAELATHFGRSKQTIVRIGGGLRKRNPDLCPPKRDDVESRMDQAVKQYAASIRKTTVNSVAQAVGEKGKAPSITPIARTIQ
jgi:hypothetical protein